MHPMDDCIPFRGRATGYASTTVDGIKMGAHRAAWIEAYGPIPPGLLVIHICDNPPCVNPAHLALGTQASNMADARRKGRTHHPFGNQRTVGSKHGMAKLTEDDVVNIKRLLGTTSQQEIARQFGISQSIISGIATGKRWSHVTAP